MTEYRSIAPRPASGAITQYHYLDDAKLYDPGHSLSSFPTPCAWLPEQSPSNNARPLPDDVPLTSKPSILYGDDWHPSLEASGGGWTACAGLIRAQDGSPTSHIQNNRDQEFKQEFHVDTARASTCLHGVTPHSTCTQDPDVARAQAKSYAVQVLSRMGHSREVISSIIQDIDQEDCFSRLMNMMPDGYEPSTCVYPGASTADNDTQMHDCTPSPTEVVKNELPSPVFPQSPPKSQKPTKRPRRLSEGSRPYRP